MRIIEATVADRPSVVGLLRLQLDEHGVALSADQLGVAVDAVFSDMKRGCLLLAMTEATAAGIAYLSFAWSIEYGGNTARLEELYVLPSHRAQGVGAQLLQAALDHAKSCGCNVVDLEVQSDHDRAGRLYARHGFERLPRTRWLKQLC